MEHGSALGKGAIIEDTSLPPDITYSGKYLYNKNIKYKRFFVYGWRRNNHYLYIGRTEAGWGKFRRTHTVINVKEPRLFDDCIDLWFCEGFRELDKLEKDLIEFFKPKYNIAYNPDARKKRKLHIVKAEEEAIIPTNELMTCKNDKEFRELRKKYK